MGIPVRTLTGTPRAGWIVLMEWHHKRDCYVYHIQVKGEAQPRKTVSQRYREEELQAIEDEYAPVEQPSTAEAGETDIIA